MIKNDCESNLVVNHSLPKPNKKGKNSIKTILTMRNILLLLVLSNTLNALPQQLRVEKLRCEYKENPMGMDIPNPRLSWQISKDTLINNILQKACRIQVAVDNPQFTNNIKLVWDTKRIDSEQSVQIKYSGNTLSPKTRYYWRVKIWDNHGRESEWSKPGYWETGLSDTTYWQAQWIMPDLKEDENANNPSPLLRKVFHGKKNIKKARLYITSKGLYYATINGKPVTDQVFTPGWTSYNKRLQYQAYNVTDLIKAGPNVTGVMLGDGWYRGRFGFGQERRNLYGSKLALMYQLEIEYADGEKKFILSDSTWKSHTGPVRMSNIYDGETYNANYEIVNWDTPQYNDKEWHGVITAPFPKNNIVPSMGVPVKRMEELKPFKKIITPKKELVFDFGQNMVGRAKIRLKGHKGDTLAITHAEVLDKDGNFYTDNLRSAKQKIEYIFKDDEEIVYEPYFTFQGFRYICIKNFPGEILKENITAVVIHSEMEPTGYFECSDPMINQLQSNIRWGQKGNFLDVPTDCPQRDERMGWTGDAQAFASTAMFNFNTAAFYNKWLKDLEADQYKSGSVPYVIPDVLNSGGSTGWGDVATILPYTLYLKYGDKRILEEQYTSMKNWVEFLHSLARKDFIINSGFHFGDWLFFIHPTDWNNKPGYTDIDFIATAFFAYSSKILANTAEIIGNKKDMEKYNLLFDSIKTNFQKEFMTSMGRLSPHSQTAYTLALYFNLVPENLKEKAVSYLVEDIQRRDYHLSTGFLGTPYLCSVLSENGKKDIAYKLLMQKTYPSWLYPVTKGATTIWERWDGIKPDGNFQTTEMNSFNHYAYGAIGDWMYSEVAGIQYDKNNPGYKHIIIKPEPDTLLTYARARYESLYGTIESAWETEKDSIFMSVLIPSNTTATIHLPYSNKKQKVGSGKYEYRYKMDR
jgi:alpha-L-rhamnosidase